MGTLETRRPFPRADAVSAGISAKQLRGSSFRRIFSGGYIDARVPNHPLVRAGAALLFHPSTAFASHFSAGRIYGVPLPVHPFEHVTVTCASERTAREGVRCHVARSHAVVPWVLDDVRLSSPVQMFIELASLLSLVDLVVVGDALVRLRLVTVPDLSAACEVSTGRYAKAARRAASYVRARVDSAMETRLRMLILLAGLPELDEQGWRIVVVTSEGIYKKPQDTVERVHRALKQRKFPKGPNRPSDGWQPFLPAA